MAGYLVTAGAVTVETSIGPGRAHVDVFRGARLPDDVPGEQIQTLLRLGSIVPVDEPGPADAPEPAAAPVPDVDAVPDGSAAVVLAWVNGDPERAVRALAVEQAKDGGGRTTVVAALTKLIPASPAAQS
ncbi:MAG TPA: hypothetical protein VHA75_11370 [Rugosimonospora sp.]|nr:hypothetical protein [Rugosimonospora sp.]